MAQTKSDIRADIRKLKSKHSNTQAIADSHEICNRMELCAEFQNAHRILLYHSLADEVNTHQLIQRWSDMKEIYLPRVNGEQLQLAHYCTPDDLEMGSYSIIEPKKSTISSIDINDIELVILPAMAIDRSGNRLGRGKGYYDRLLHNYTKGCKIGIIYDYQLLDNIPSDKHDIKIDKIITNKEIVTTNGISK
ncbi:MAG: 5-formyltetrahydrofolate cyclo-ligase [Bacteroidales bacterium]